MSLKPVGPQPPTQPGWYWVKYPNMDAPAPTHYRLLGTRLIRSSGGNFPDVEAANGATWQPVAAPVMEGA